MADDKVTFQVPSKEASDCDHGSESTEVHNGNVSELEVFTGGDNSVDFRTVGWVRAAMFFLKMTFAAGVLSIPASLYTLGAVAGALFILFWGVLNTYMAYLQGRFKIAHPSIHTVADSAQIAAQELTGSKRTAYAVREATELLYIMAWILCSGLSTLGLSIALNAVTKHGTCSVVFGFVSYVIIASVASIHRIHSLGWITWVGFISTVSAVLIVVIAVTIPARPAAAPQTGDFDLGFAASPAKEATFATAWAASLAIFASSANTSGFVPVISEMKRPHDYFKSLYVAMGWITCAYLSLGLTVYAYCGKWVTSPALGSAGPTIKTVSYAVSIPGTVAGAMICVHVAAKSLFVRFLRGTRHLTENTMTHWSVWLSCTYGTGLVGWVLCEAIPFYGSLVSLIGAMGFGPLGIVLPSVLWFCLDRNALTGRTSRVIPRAFHAGLVMLGLFVTFGGTYAVVVSIVDQYKSGLVGRPFQCADNSNTIQAA
ncbi:hypothetical protein FE257_005289 [Aspergillus nanangensis]|uniref:Amino acid transporter transmembrane domain-containing protein n=1 Tax=Aspergillus nanangensis TaxID=2582783 RepID=A0AAD4CQW0_ASPNN|nr:hypothetical protein FE257_005289 [Aspergillus nanangensis]